MNRMALCYVTHPDREHADRISAQLLEEKRVACVNTVEGQSDYIWKTLRESEAECYTLYKTTVPALSKLIPRIQELHAYEEPCIWWIEVETTPGYANYLQEEVKSIDE